MAYRRKGVWTAKRCSAFLGIAIAACTLLGFGSKASHAQERPLQEQYAHRPCTQQDVVGAWEMVMSIPWGLTAGQFINSSGSNSQYFIFYGDGRFAHAVSQQPFTERSKALARRYPTGGSYLLDERGTLIMQSPIHAPELAACVVLLEDKYNPVVTVRQGDVFLIYFTQEGQPLGQHLLLRKDEQEK